MTIEFSPLLSWPLLYALAAIAVTIAGITLWRRLRGAILRTLALAAILLALANPTLLQEDREALSTVVPIIVDRSQSQETQTRKSQTDAAILGLTERFARYPGIETRIVESRDDGNSDTPATRLYSALRTSINDVPPSRIGGAVFLTDGQIHDLPGIETDLGFSAPVHGLITGKANEFDRRIEVVRGPRFGIVGEEQRLTLRIIDDGQAPPGGTATVDIRMNGEPVGRLQAISGVDTNFAFTVARGGNNVLEFSVGELPGEVSTVNNRAVHVVDGIRQNLRVLLVSGEPHSGERAWRNLLKSDASVDLVHFTILRPPEKQDGTPINELSLIAFPTRELFVEKIKDFDLIIFDRYKHRGVLPILYYDYIAQYVSNGGALLIAAGPEHAGEDSIATTPLERVLPAMPTGEVHNTGFYPHLSDIGQKHPVTRDLDGSASTPPAWGRWFRSIEVDTPKGQTIMEADGNRPLLVLDREGEGRVAMLLSDHGWLWARGFEGGGPHVSLYRRIAHWLMKEPELEEEALTARASGRTLEATRQTIGDAPGPATIRYPSGRTESAAMSEAGSGRYRLERNVEETGLFEVTNGQLSTLVHIGAVDAPEFKAMISSPDVLKPYTDKSRGLVTRIAPGTDGISLPDILTVRSPVRVADKSRMVFRLTDETALKGVRSLPLFAGFLGLGILLLAISAMWWREGR